MIIPLYLGDLHVRFRLATVDTVPEGRVMEPNLQRRVRITSRSKILDKMKFKSGGGGEFELFLLRSKQMVKTKTLERGRPYFWFPSFIPLHTFNPTGIPFSRFRCSGWSFLPSGKQYRSMASKIRSRQQSFS